MVAPSLSAAMVSTNNPERSRILARRLIESMLLDRKEIEKFDASLSSGNPLQFDRDTAALIRGMYEQWARDAQSLLQRIAEVERRLGPIAESAELSDAFGRTMAMLSISLDDMEAGTNDIVEGRLHSAEEVRRELRLRAH